MRVRTSARAARVTTHARPRNNTNVTAEVTSNTTPRRVYEGVCPECGEPTLVVRPNPNAPPPWRVHCRRATCEVDSAEWLRGVAATVEAPDASVILDDAPYRLRDYLHSERRGDTPPAPLAPERVIAERTERLLRTKEIRLYLTDVRGLSIATLREQQIGWDGSAITFPVHDPDGRLVNEVRRPVPTRDERKYVVLGGRGLHNGGVQFYPYPVPERGVLLVEGLIDAALGRQLELPVLTSTHGVTSLPPDWAELLRGRVVAVAYDVGAEPVTRRHVAQFRAAGIAAWAVELRRLLPTGQKDIGEYLTDGGTPQQLKRFVRRERRRARR